MVLDYQRRAANPDVPDVCLRVKYDIPSAQQVVSDVQRDVQCSAVLVHRDIQDFLNSVQYRSVCRAGDSRINEGIEY